MNQLEKKPINRYLGNRVGPLAGDRWVPGFWLRWREQKPRRCDSLLQLGYEQRRRHCLPLNFFRTPDSDCTMSPFLKRCGVAACDRGVAGCDRGVSRWSSMLEVLPRLCTLLRLLLPDMSLSPSIGKVMSSRRNSSSLS